MLSCSLRALQSLVQVWGGLKQLFCFGRKVYHKQFCLLIMHVLHFSAPVIYFHIKSSTAVKHNLYAQVLEITGTACARRASPLDET